MNAAIVAATVMAFWGGTAQGDVFRLVDGSQVVGEVARSTDGSFLVTTLDGPRTLPLTTIEKHETRSTIERMLERLGAEAGTDGARWLALARLAAAKGLFEQALDAADRAAAHLAEFTLPTELAAVPIGNVMRNGALRPADVAALLALQADAQRAARRDLAGKRLAERLVAAGSPLAPPLIAALHDGISNANPAIRSAALRSVAEARVEELANAVADALLSDTTQEVRRSALIAARALTRPPVVARLCSALEAGNPKLREAALDTLEELPDTHAVASLVRALDSGAGGYQGVRANVSVTNQVATVFDFDVEIANGAAIANPEVRVIQEGAVLDATVLGVSVRSNHQERARIARLLAHLTHQEFGDDAKRWRSWLAAQGSPK